MKQPVEYFLEEAVTFFKNSKTEKGSRLAGQGSALLSAISDRKGRVDDVLQKWEPTAENIQSLPAPIRAHVEACERRVKEGEATSDYVNTELQTLLKMVKAGVDELEIFAQAAKLQEALR